METSIDIDIRKINQEVKMSFQAMKYENLSEDINLVKEWLNKRNNVICGHGVEYKNYSGTGIQVIVNNLNSGDKLATILLPSTEEKQKIADSIDVKKIWSDISQLERIKLIKKFAREIEQNCDLICKIEACTRGLLMKDSDKYGVKLLAQYLNYYSNWAISTKIEQNGPTIVYATDEICLGLVGCALGTALAQGCAIILHADPAISVCATLLIELSVKIGIPDGVIKLMPSRGDDVWLPAGKATIYLFVDLYTERFKNIVYNNKQIIALSKSKTPMIIFNNSDLDSACECAISAIWEYSGMLPWASNTILVQEDIYVAFVDKMKARLGKISVGNGIDKLADISHPSKETKKLVKMIKDARLQGIDIYQQSNDNTKWTPSLIVGAKVYPNSVIGEDLNNCTAATVLAFRTPKEAIALANNSRQGIAASVWCQNIDVINEVTSQLNVGTVWVNSHGIIKPSVPFTTHKLDGTGYIGGPTGFYEYADQCFRQFNTRTRSSVNAIALAQKAQYAWNHLPLVSRMETLSKWAIDLEQHKSEFLEILDIDGFISKIFECITRYSSTNISTQIENFELVIQREAIGVIVLLAEDLINISLTVSALLLGNSVVLVTAKNSKYYELLSKFLPSSILVVTDTEQIINAIGVAETNPRIAFIGVNTVTQKFQKSYENLNDLDFVFRRCTLSKNIWLSKYDSI